MFPAKTPGPKLLPWECPAPGFSSGVCGNAQEPSCPCWRQPCTPALSPREVRGAHRISSSASPSSGSEEETLSIQIFSFRVQLLASSSFLMPGLLGTPRTPLTPLLPLSPCQPWEALPGGAGALAPMAAGAAGLLPPGGTPGAAEATPGPGRDRPRSRERPRHGSSPGSGRTGVSPAARSPPCPPAGCWHRASGSCLLPCFHDSLIARFPNFSTK